jgi:hypothetical protein
MCILVSPQGRVDSNNKTAASKSAIRSLPPSTAKRVPHPAQRAKILKPGPQGRVGSNKEAAG